MRDARDRATTFFRQVFRLEMFSLLVLTYGSGAILIYFFTRDKFRTRMFLARWVRLHSRLLLFIFGVSIGVDSQNPGVDISSTSRINSNFIVSNHLGYLDALVLSSLLPVSFVTSVEIRDAFFIGWLTRLSGCLYVERRNKANIESEIIELTRALNSRLNVCVFPEATSTNGESVLRFRQPLYNAAVISGQPVLPACLNYETINNERVTPFNRDLLFWYGDMPFFSHLWNFWSIRRAQVRVTFGAPIYSTLHAETAGQLAASSHQFVSSIYRPITGV